MVLVGSGWPRACALRALPRRGRKVRSHRSRFGGDLTTRSGPHDWPQWGGWSTANNTPEGHNIPIKFSAEKKENVRWTAKLGSQTYGNPVIANGKVYVGTNNGAGYVKRFPASVDLGCLLCFDEKTGKFLWQHSSQKLPQGRVNDWPMQGVCSTPLLRRRPAVVRHQPRRSRLPRHQGFHDGKNDGPFTAEPNENKDEADVLWYLDMMTEWASRSTTCAVARSAASGDTLFVCTSNGVDESAPQHPRPQRPELLRAWTRTPPRYCGQDNSPGKTSCTANGPRRPTPSLAASRRCSSAAATVGSQLPGEATDDGRTIQVLWKFDCNPKDSQYSVTAAAPATTSSPPR